MNKETGTAHLMTEKALKLFNDYPKSANYTLVEGKYIYGKNGQIIRTDKPKTNADKNLISETVETKEENSANEAKRGRKPKDASYTNSITDSSFEYIPETLLESNES